MICAVPILYIANSLIEVLVNKKISEGKYRERDSKNIFLNKKTLIVVAGSTVLMIIIYFFGDENLMQSIAGWLLLPILWHLGTNIGYLSRLHFSLVHDENFESEKNLTTRRSYYNVLGFLVPLILIGLITNHPLVGGGLFYLVVMILGAWRRLKKVSNSNISD